MALGVSRARRVALVVRDEQRSAQKPGFLSRVLRRVVPGGRSSDFFYESERQEYARWADEQRVRAQFPERPASPL